MEHKNTIDIVTENGHYVAYVNGEFYCSGDTYLEVIQELTDANIT